MRSKQPVSFFHTKHPKHKSSPVYSIAADNSNLYIALDQCLNLISFSGLRNREITTRYKRAYWKDFLSRTSKA